MRKFKSATSLKALFLWAVFSSLLLGNFVFAQAVRKISGKIVTAAGKNLDAASVINKRTNVGAYTDNSGSFTIDAQTGDVLIPLPH